MSKGMSHLFKTQEGREKLNRLIETNLPKILEKREKEGFYSTDTTNDFICENKKKYGEG